MVDYDGVSVERSGADKQVLIYWRLQFFQLGLHGLRLHRRTVIRVQHQRLVQTLFTQLATLQELGGILATLGLMDFITDDLAAVEILEHVQVVELPTHRRRAVGNVTAPDFAGAAGCMSRWCGTEPGCQRGDRSSSRCRNFNSVVASGTDVMTQRNLHTQAANYW